MTKAIRHFVAIFLMLWLPVFSGSAAAMVACPHMMSQDMSHHMAMSAPDGHCNMQHQTQTDNAPSDCDQCGACHVACSPGITATSHIPVTIASNVEHASPSQLFDSITLPLLDPPPLVLL